MRQGILCTFVCDLNLVHCNKWGKVVFFVVFGNHYFNGLPSSIIPPANYSFYFVSRAQAMSALCHMPWKHIFLLCVLRETFMFMSMVQSKLSQIFTKLTIFVPL